MLRPRALQVLFKMANPRVFFDIAIGGKAAGRIVFEVRPGVLSAIAACHYRTSPCSPRHIKSFTRLSILLVISLYAAVRQG